MGSQNWISLMEYSAKYRVSISTLRRRIKANELQFQFTDGKYLLKDVSPPVELVSMPTGPEVVAPPTQAKPQIQIPLGAQATTTEVGQTVEKLLGEIKKAYMQILQEKEEQILLLRSEVSDLKTLTGVLEEQNEHLKKRKEPMMTADPKFELELEL